MKLKNVLATLLLAVALLWITGKPVYTQTVENEYPVKVQPTKFGAELHTEHFKFINQDITAICWADYCYMVIKRGDPTPQPN